MMKPETILTENELPLDVIQAVKEGRKIEAIKMLREQSGIGLANAKVLIDKASRTHGPKKSYPFARREGPAYAKLFRSLFLITLLGVAYYLYTRF